MNILNGPITTVIRKKVNELVTYLNTYSFENSKVITKTIEVVVSAAELIAMYTTPKTLVAAPGVGYALAFIRAVAICDSTGTAFSGGGVITINYGSGAAQSSDLAATFLTGGDKVFNLEKLNAAGGLTMPVNTSLVLTNATGVFAAGTGVVRLQLTYAVHETSL